MGVRLRHRRRPAPARRSRSRTCTFCADKFMAGAEAYGGLGDTASLTLGETSHYIAPLIGWQPPKGLRLSFSPGFGLTSTSLNRVYRVGVAYEFNQIGNWFHPARRYAMKHPTQLSRSLIASSAPPWPLPPQHSHWDRIPAKDHARANPLAGRPEAIAAGALVYADHCAAMPQADARGDGHKRPSLRTDHLAPQPTATSSGSSARAIWPTACPPGPASPPSSAGN